MGLVERDVAVDAIRSSSVLLLPSSWEETFGLTVVEAMCVGTPVIATSHGSFIDIVTDGHDGLLVPPDDVAALVEAVERLHDDHALAGCLGANARRTYEERYVPDVVMSQLEAVYENACAGRPAARSTGTVETRPVVDSW